MSTRSESRRNHTADMARAFALLLLTLVAVTGCGHPAQPSVRDLQTYGVTDLVMPGAVVLGQTTTTGSNGFEPTSAGLQATFAVDARPSAVLAYYQAALTQRGWSRDDNAGFSQTDWATQWAWTKGHVITRVGPLTKAAADLKRQAIPAAAHRRTVFAVTVGPTS